jgi:hypothetical protein
MENKQDHHAKIKGHRRSSFARLQLLTSALVLILAVLHAVPAWAVHFVALEELDVDCSRGMHLKQATGVPGGAVHTYAFGGACNLRVVSTDGPGTQAVPPVVGSAHWDQASNTYTESLHLLAPITVKDIAPDVSSVKVGTYPEVASFKCDVDPVINHSAHCTLESQYNDTGWQTPYQTKYLENGGDQVDGFAWSANHNRPLLLGLATESQAATLSQKNKRPQISCDGLKLQSVKDIKGTRSYHFDGTCELYHTEDGSGGLRLTHVLVSGYWNAPAQVARETFNVLAPGNEGGGLYKMADYNCAADPFVHGNVQCSLEQPLNKVSPVYDPITDLRAKRPIAAGRANPAQVATLLKAGSKSKKAGIALSTMGGAHQAGASASRKPHMPKPKFSISGYAQLTRSCAADNLVRVTFSVHDDAGFYHPAGGNLGYIEAGESGGAGLKSKSVGLPAMTPGKTWNSTLQVGTDKSAFARLPGMHQLILHIGPTNALKSSLAYVPPRPLRLTVNFPAGYCQPKLRMGSPAGMRMQPGGAKSTAPMHQMQPNHLGANGRKMESPKASTSPEHRMSLPAVQLR